MIRLWRRRTSDDGCSDGHFLLTLTWDQEGAYFQDICAHWQIILWRTLDSGNDFVQCAMRIMERNRKKYG